MAPTMKGGRPTIEEQAKGRVKRPNESDTPLGDKLRKAQNDLNEAVKRSAIGANQAAGNKPPIDEAEILLDSFIESLQAFSWGMQNQILTGILSTILDQRKAVIDTVEKDLQERHYDMESFHKLANVGNLH